MNVTKLAVLSNALLIALTTRVVDYEVFRGYVRYNGISNTDLSDFFLSEFDTALWSSSFFNAYPNTNAFRCRAWPGIKTKEGSDCTRIKTHYSGKNSGLGEPITTCYYADYRYYNVSVEMC